MSCLIVVKSRRGQVPTACQNLDLSSACSNHLGACSSPPMPTLLRAAVFESSQRAGCTPHRAPELQHSSCPVTFAIPHPLGVCLAEGADLQVSGCISSAAGNPPSWGLRWRIAPLHVENGYRRRNVAPLLDFRLVFRPGPDAWCAAVEVDSRCVCSIFGMSSFRKFWGIRAGELLTQLLTQNSPNCKTKSDETPRITTEIEQLRSRLADL